MAPGFMHKERQGHLPQNPAIPSELYNLPLEVGRTDQQNSAFRSQRKAFTDRLIERKRQRHLRKVVRQRFRSKLISIGATSRPTNAPSVGVGVAQS